ncbi:MAG TPA: hypothetical protein DCE41_01970 [Cytophagales bacterium]|nr:hypothetical protein [Cytophagales bacterium]HAA18263.1 hypothetical protein [Cytophagales bacterium]HAP58996.1 hypothetical protein [Cytophagales bacterium]
MKLLDRLSNLVFPNSQPITEEVLRYYEKNPDELDLIINREAFHIAYLGIIFVLGIGATVAARMVAYFFGDQLGEFVNSVVLDVISELGIALFGGAVVAYLIEYLNKRQYQQNIKFRRQVKAMLAERSAAQESVD